MSTLLRVDSSPMGENSISRKLTSQFANAWAKAHPHRKIITGDRSTSEVLIGELEQADEYVFGIPMHNFNVPSAPKLWIDPVVRSGRTFSHGTDGPKGPLTGKKATLLVASGGGYEAGGAMAALNFANPYLETILRLIGVTDITTISAEARPSSEAVKSTRRLPRAVATEASERRSSMSMQ